jgi:REP element-mobilizing transposase RayT
MQMVFAVKYCKTVIEGKWKDQLHAVLGNLINDNKCKTLIGKGAPDHVHCILGINPSASISELTKDVKAKSSNIS